MKVLRAAALAVAMSVVSAASGQEISELPLLEDIPVSEGYGPNPPDVIGIQFGDTAADAIAKLKAAYPDAQIREQREIPGVSDNRGNSVYFEYLAGVSLSKPESPTEVIHVRFTTPASGNRVFQVARTIDYDRDQYGSMEELRRSIEAKYGEPMLVEPYPHQNRDEVTYTWEKREKKPFGTQNVQGRGFAAQRPDSVNVCLGAGESSAYGHAEIHPQVYGFRSDAREGNPGWDACIGGLKFVIFYGNNDKTVSRVRITATDYDRSMRDARMADNWLRATLLETASSNTGSGAPKL